MARLRGSRFQRTSGPRRQSSWQEGPFGQVVGVSGSSNNIFTTSQQIVAEGLTLVRTRGQLMVQLVTADALSKGFQYAFGVCMVSENAAGIGVTAVPSPLTDVAWDGWFVYETGWVLAVDSSVSETLGPASHVIDIDSKAMRRLKTTDVMLAMLEVVEIGTCTMHASYSSRMLVKLS